MFFGDKTEKGLETLPPPFICILGGRIYLDKPARLIIRLLFGFASDPVFVKHNQCMQILRRQCCLNILWEGEYMVEIFVEVENIVGYIVGSGKYFAIYCENMEYLFCHLTPPFICMVGGRIYCGRVNI